MTTSDGAPRLEIRDLQIVLAVAAAGSTAKAAGTLHLTQSAVSRALVLAEDKLGVQLFERRARGLSPTAAGQRLIGGAGAVLAQLGQLERHVGGVAAAPAHVRLVCECYTAYRWLPSALTRLRGRLPGLEVTLKTEYSTDPVAALLTREVDVALLTTSPVRGAAHDRPLFADEIVFVVAASHPLASRPSLTPADLRAYPLITSSNAARAEARGFFTKVFGPRVPRLEFLRLPLTEAIIDMARAGHGIAILSEWVASGYLDTGELVVRRLASGPVRRPWRIAFRRDTADAAQLLASALDGSPPRLVQDRAAAGEAQRRARAASRRV
ncbi:MAG TPA: LysR family transcriptional regulator [Kofleriaceae bacterium]|nr:LysR family transcriptional regulator [Kofleriaceae bacterium]